MPPLALNLHAPKRFLQHTQGLFKAEVYIAQLVDGTKVVCKDYSALATRPITTWLAKYLVQREFKVLQALNDWAFAPKAGPSKDGLVLVQEYIAGTSLSQKTLSKTTASELYAKLQQALHELHQRGIAHNDIHANNIMLRPDGQPVLIDFTSATQASRWFSWHGLQSLLFRFDNRHLVKIKRQLGCRLDAADLALLRRPAWLERLLHVWKETLLPALKRCRRR